MEKEMDQDKQDLVDAITDKEALESLVLTQGWKILKERIEQQYINPLTDDLLAAKTPATPEGIYALNANKKLRLLLKAILDTPETLLEEITTFLADRKAMKEEEEEE